MKAALGLGLVLVSAVGCATDQPPTEPTSAPVEQAGPAYLEIQLTDTSVARADGVDAQLWITVGRLDIEHADGTWISLAADPIRFDLFAVEHGDASVVASAMLPAGGYRALAIEIDAGQLVIEGATTPATIVGGAIELPLASQLADADARALVLDFDASKSLPTVSAPATTTAPPKAPSTFVLAPAITVASFAEM